MPNDTIVRAPYNFVPFSHKILSYEDEIPAHDAVDPSLKTGEIHITMTAKTPVFVSNGGKDDAAPMGISRYPVPLSGGWCGRICRS